MVFLLEVLRIHSVLHIVPTLCCIVTAAESLTPPQLLFAVSQSFWCVRACVCFFVCIYQFKIVWVVLGFNSHISKVTSRVIRSCLGTFWREVEITSEGFFKGRPASHGCIKIDSDKGQYTLMWVWKRQHKNCVSADVSEDFVLFHGGYIHSV